MAALRIIALIALLAGFGWYDLGQDRSSGEIAQLVRDHGDPRHPRRILLVGNSRTSGHDMPGMLRRIADSAGDSEKYQTLTLAPNGSSFETLANDWRVEREIGGAWDDAIVQGESRGQSDPYQADSFMANGAHLLKALHPRRGPPLLIVNWLYDRSAYTSDIQRKQHYSSVQDAHAALTRETGAKSVNIGGAWEQLHTALPTEPLTEDGNHPTIAASYFVALCLYETLSGKNVDTVRWAPEGVSSEVAARIRHFVSQHRSEL
jgi:hypothetical protein